MTREEAEAKARDLVQNRLWINAREQHPDIAVREIAAALLAAVAEEREAIAKDAESCLYVAGTRKQITRVEDAWNQALRQFAAAIRARGKE